MSNKKVFFKIDNGYAVITAELSGVLTQLEAECQDVKDNDDMDMYSWAITPILMTDEELRKITRGLLKLKIYEQPLTNRST